MLTRFRRPDLALFAAAFFVSTWDLLLVRKVGGFTLKAYQPLFLLCAGVNAWPYVRTGRLDELVAPFRRPFPLAMLALAFFYLGLAPWSAFPLKSLLYSFWMLFDLVAIWLTTQRLFREHPPATFGWIAFTAILFHATVILVDYAAYPFGYRGGVIGYNQDILTNLMISRPHAYSSEPSYAAVTLSLGALSLAPFVLLRARYRPLGAAGVLAVLFAILATTSRSGWACLAIGLVLLAVLPVLAGERIPWKTVTKGLAALPVLVGIFLVTTPKAQLDNLSRLMVDSVFHGYDSSGVARVKALGLAVQMARETHWVGTGVGASYRYYKDHGGFDYNFQESFDQKMYGNEVIMSTWGQLLAEGGLVGVALYAFAGVALAVALWRRWRGEDSLFAYGSLAACVAFFGFGALWLGNVCRGDVWVWFALWGGFAYNKKT